MRYLILSDIHANWEALQAVLEHSEGHYDQVVCLGDVVGYGADPNVVTEWVRGSVTAIVRGNHDKACVGLSDLEWFNPSARRSAIWTHEMLSSQNLEYLRGLPRGPASLDSFQMVHGSPLDEDEYLISSEDAAVVSRFLQHQLSFFGHTHVQGGFLCHPRGVVKLNRVRPNTDCHRLMLSPDHVYLINPGSVGQPRDTDPRAAYAIYEPDQRAVTYYRIPYDVATAQQKILSAGLPPRLADRLAYGQ